MGDFYLFISSLSFGGRVPVETYRVRPLLFSHVAGRLDGSRTHDSMLFRGWWKNSCRVATGKENRCVNLGF